MHVKKIGLGGGCHWCTEAVFQSLRGVILVEQGYIASIDENSSFSEGICVTYNPKSVNLQLLIEVHLLTHKSTKNHSMRNKYRSAIYTFNKTQKEDVQTVLSERNKKISKATITQVLRFGDFKSSKEDFTNYYYNNPEKPFCQTFINPKIKFLLENYRDAVDLQKLSFFKTEPIL